MSHLKSAHGARRLLLAASLLTGATLAAQEVESDARPESTTAAFLPGAADELPEHAVLRLGTRRLMHDGAITDLAWAPDGEVMHSSGADGRRYSWGGPTARPVDRDDGAEGPIVSVSLSPDGEVLVTGRRLPEGDFLRIEGPADESHEHHGRGGRARFSPDGRHLALWHIRAEENGHLVTLLDGRGVEVLDDHESGLDTISEVSFSPDGTLLALAGGTRARGRAPQGALELVELGDTLATRALVTLEAPWAQGVAVLPGGERVAVGTADGQVLLLATEDGSILGRWSEDDVPVTALVSHPTQERLAVGNRIGRLTLLDAASDTLVWATRTYTSQALTALAFDPAGERLATGGRDHLVRLHDASDGHELLPRRGHESGVRCVALSPEGDLVITGGFDGRVIFWDGASGEVRHALPDHFALVRSVACSPDGTRAASVGDDGHLRLWDTATGELLASSESSRQPLTGVTFSPDGTRVATSSHDYEVCLWDATTAERLTTVDTGRLAFTVDFSPDGATLVAGTSEIFVIDVDSGEVRRQIQGTSPIARVVVSSDGTRVVSANADRHVRVHDLATGEELLAFLASDSRVSSVALSPDDRLIASVGGVDGVVSLWDAETGAPTGRLEGHEGLVFDLDFTADGSRLASACSDMTALVWTLP